MAVLQGIDQFEAKLKSLELVVQKQILMRTLKEDVEPTRAAAASLAPIGQTGKLHERIKIASVPSLSTAQVAVVRVGPARSVFYGLFSEVGTVHMTAQPFLDPAYESTKDEVLRQVAEDFKTAVESV